MKKFMDTDFLLSNSTAVHLFETYAKDQPIFDWHCHLIPKEIWEDKPYQTITELWLGADHYKWKALRALGTPERLITGDGSDYDKFMAWAKALPHLIGNPLYHWSHLELQRFFGIYEPLSEKTAPDIWEKANAMLKQPGFTPRNFIERSNVMAVCTTDDPADSLEYHQKILDEGKLKAKVLPAMRPDKAMQTGAADFIDYMKRLGEAAGVDITSFKDLKEALKKRIAFFDSMGCRASDHGFLYLPYAKADETGIERIFAKALAKEELTQTEHDAYQTSLMLFLAEEYHKFGWVMELHIGAVRNNNRRMFKQMGPDTGFDAVYDASCAHSLANLLGDMDEHGTLPKTVLFNLNPKDNIVLSTVMSCFQSEEAVSKLQFGSAWWFLDHKPGMEAQMETLATTGVLSKFVGMVTDSRSFSSYPRHEYFRRIFCNMVGSWVENGEYPNDEDMLKEIVEGVCYKNANSFFSPASKQDDSK